MARRDRHECWKCNQTKTEQYMTFQEGWGWSCRNSKAVYKREVRPHNDCNRAQARADKSGHYFYLPEANTF